MPAYYSNSGSTAANTVWIEWNGTAATNDGAWHYWTSGSSATTSVSNTIWLEWNAATGESRQIHPNPTAWQKPAPPTAEQLEAEKQRRLDLEKRLAEETAKRIAAEKRAEELLLSQLSKEQRKEYREKKSFKVVGKDGHRYDIGPRWSGHVERLNDKGKPVERFCIHPRVQVPVADNQLLAKLMLETDPDQFRKVANVTPLAC